MVTDDVLQDSDELADHQVSELVHHIVCQDAQNELKVLVHDIGVVLADRNGQLLEELVD